MAATQYGVALEVGVGQTLGDYIIEDIGEGNKDVKNEDIFDEDGARVTRIVMQLDDKTDLSLIGKSGADPETDFPVGAPCVVTGFTSFFVDDMTFTRSESAMRVSVSLTNIGFVNLVV